MLLPVVEKLAPGGKKCLQSNTLVGTPEYFAPESIIGKGEESRGNCRLIWVSSLSGMTLKMFICVPRSRFVICQMGANISQTKHVFLGA